MATEELVEKPSSSTSLRDKVFSDPTAPPFSVESDGHSMVHVMGHREVQYVLENPNQEFTRSLALFLPPDPHPGFDALFAMDPFPLEGRPGRHTELRAIVEPWFRTRAVRVLEPRIRDITRELLRDIVGRGTGEFDLARDLAYDFRSASFASSSAGIQRARTGGARSWTSLIKRKASTTCPGS